MQIVKVTMQNRWSRQFFPTLIRFYFPCNIMYFQKMFVYTGMDVCPPVQRTGKIQDSRNSGHCRTWYCILYICAHQKCVYTFALVINLHIPTYKLAHHWKLVHICTQACTYTPKKCVNYWIHVYIHVVYLSTLICILNANRFINTNVSCTFL